MLAGSQREQVLVLTRKGRAPLPRLSALADRNDAHFFAHLSSEQRQSLRAILQALVIHHQIKAVPIA
jgi:DNA-binding MarR family transcriptional regulator